MKRLLILFLASTIASPALAQHTGHQPATPEEETPSSQDPHAGHSIPTAPDAPTSDPHAGHDMPSAPQSAPVVTGSPAGHEMERPATSEADPHAGHSMNADPQPVPTTDPHAGHDVGAAADSPQAPPVAPPPPRAYVGPEHAADLVYSDAAMTEAREELYEGHGGVEVYKFLIDQLEAKIREGRDGYAWDGQFWYGGDINKLWLKTEGEGEFGGGIEEAEVQALWSRAINPWFDLQLGLRQDFQSEPDRTHLVAGIQGLVPYWFEVEGTAFLSNKGDVTARFESEYDLRLTQTLIMQPGVELDLALQDIPELRIGSGLSTAEIGARLRYEFFPNSGPAVIAPYVGVQYERAFGDTADFRRAAGEGVDGWSLLVGIRTWF